MKKNKKLPFKKVWFNEELYDIVSLIPAKDNNYLVVKRQLSKTVGDIDMVLIDCGNDEFYPNSSLVADEIIRLIDLRQKIKYIQQDLERDWLKANDKISKLCNSK